MPTISQFLVFALPHRLTASAVHKGPVFLPCLGIDRILRTCILTLFFIITPQYVEDSMAVM